MIKRQKYHLEPDRGLLNDPNGLVFYKDMYHVFFQWNRFEKNHSYKEWGHFTSKDLLHWNWEGSALLPDQFYEQNGVYSGSALIKDGQLRLFYTGNNKSGGVRKSSQCLAVTEDGKTFQKKGIVLSTPTEFTEHFRDPKVWQDGDNYYMVIGAQMKNGRGSVALCSSKDAENWKFELVLAKSKEYEMVECPDYFQVDGQGILLYCPQHRDNESDSSLCSFSAYKEFGFNDIVSGKIEDSNVQNLDEGRKKMDQGFDFYAPQTFTSPDGRKILFAWMSRMEEEEEKLFGAGTHIYKDAEGFAADEAATLRLLVCANGPAVQAPLAGISGVVLVRRSAGPAAYRQMLARALAACGSVPVAELSATFEGLTCVPQLRKECGEKPFPLSEPLSACRRAYRQLRRALDAEWERYFAAAKQMAAKKLPLDVPRAYTFEGVAVGRWLENQRLVRAGKKNGRLTAEQVARLDKIGMNWKKRLELAWENGCASARRYRGSHSDLLVPVHYKDKDGFALGEWIVYNRQRYLSGNLPSDRVERLEALGMVWDTGSILWEKNYAAAVQYHLEHDDLEIPVKYVTPDGMALGVWLGSQRAAYKEGTLTAAQIEKLEALGVDWTNRNDRKWQTAYEAAVKYHAAHGNLDVPTEYIDEDGILLGKWVSRQRYAWQNPERSSARVTPERKALLDELGMNWEKTDSWQHRYELAVEYKKEHGSLAVPAQYRTEDGIWLGSWLSRQKLMLREGKKLSAERCAALRELFQGENTRRLTATVPPACSVREQNWLDNYQSARLYAEKKGSLLVPAGYVDENGFRLGVWISNLRAARKARPGSFQVTPEHIALLDAIGMQWDAREAKWAGAFRRAEEYCAAHGDLLVPVNYKTEDGFCLGDWVRRMRENYACAEKKLTAERIAKLEALGMVWTVPQEG